MLAKCPACQGSVEVMPLTGGQHKGKCLTCGRGFGGAYHDYSSAVESTLSGIRKYKEWQEKKDAATKGGRDA